MVVMDQKKILVITSSYDRTVDSIISRFSPDINFFRFDVDNMSAYDVAVNGDYFCIKAEKSSLDSYNCKSIYYRKPSNIQIQKIFDSPYDQFATRELFALVEGVAEIFDGPCLTRPSVMKLAGNKIFQGKIAKKCGFNQPKSMITNRTTNIPDISSGKLIVKPLAVGAINFSNHKEFVQTNIYDPSISTESLTYSPAYFQEYLKKDFEVRLTIINGNFFSVKIQSDNLVDWRKGGAKNTYTFIETPSDIKYKCEEYLSQMGMVFGCFDFIVFENEWFFLEMNVNGQWGWLEAEVDIDISSKIMEYLNV